MSWVISSYVPTIKALQHSRTRATKMIDKHSLLVVAMPETPGATDLPAVRVEQKAIVDITKSPHTIRSLMKPNVEAVLAQMQHHSIIHFACHGSSNAADPSYSHLALQGKSDSVPEKLTVRQISDVNLGSAWLAYLSACSTAKHGDVQLADESLHLASGFQAAGFAHVVASLWPSSDAICARIAARFYEGLMGKMDSGLDSAAQNKNVAASLHNAIWEIRRENLTRPYLWSQYIHVGA